ncbi:NUDIX hydrolase domain-like protein [Tirmania nivea]|nr:NUDIX hydrolase domain-like protein [Tirmania nivea]
MPAYTPLDLINQGDGFPSASSHPSLHAERLSTLSLLLHETHTIGYLLPSIASTLRDPQLSGPHWSIYGNTISLQGSSPEERSSNIHATLTLWRSKRLFRVLDGWRNELYAIYAPRGELLFTIERSAAALFGLVAYGVHLTAFVRDPAYSGGLALWVPTRSRTKSTYPGYLDNTVAGGLAAGYTAFETVVKECAEEASLPEELVREKAKCVGAISYFYIRSEAAGGESGLLQPEVQYCYDLDLSDRRDVVPRPCDDEVEGFELLGVEEVKERLGEGWFKPNCALVILDFFVRHNILTPENEPHYLEIVARLHRTFEFPLR